MDVLKDIIIGIVGLLVGSGLTVATTKIVSRSKVSNKQKAGDNANQYQSGRDINEK